MLIAKVILDDSKEAEERQTKHMGDSIQEIRNNRNVAVRLGYPSENDEN